MHKGNFTCNRMDILLLVVLKYNMFSVHCGMITGKEGGWSIQFQSLEKPGGDTAMVLHLGGHSEGLASE